MVGGSEPHFEEEPNGHESCHETVDAPPTVLSPTLQKVNSTVTGSSLVAIPMADAASRAGQSGQKQTSFISNRLSGNDISGMPQPNVYLIGERLATIHHVLGKYGLRAFRTAKISQFDRWETGPNASTIRGMDSVEPNAGSAWQQVRGQGNFRRVPVGTLQ